MTKTRILAIALLALVVTSTVQAQTTVPGPRADVVLNDPVADGTSQWTWTYAADAQPAHLANQPFIAAVKLTLTPTSGTGTRVVTLPRAQVTRETVAANCPGGPAPCLRAQDIPLPAGNFNVTMNFVSGAGVEGAATPPVPFSGSYPAPVVPSGARIQPRP